MFVKENFKYINWNSSLYFQSVCKYTQYTQTRKKKKILNLLEEMQIIQHMTHKILYSCWHVEHKIAVNYLENEARKKTIYENCFVSSKKVYTSKLSESKKKSTISSICCWVKFPNYKFTKGENKFKTFVTSPELTLSYRMVYTPLVDEGNI